MRTHSFREREQGTCRQGLLGVTKARCYNKSDPVTEVTEERAARVKASTAKPPPA
jgi:hypothetical protein